MEAYLFPWEVAVVEYVNGTAFVRCPKIPSFERWMKRRGYLQDGVWVLKTPVEDIYEAMYVHIGAMPCTYVTITFPEEVEVHFPTNEITFGGRSVVWGEENGQVASHVYAHAEGFYTLNGKLKASSGAKVIVYYVPLGTENDSILEFKIEYPHSLIEDTGFVNAKRDKDGCINGSKP